MTEAERREIWQTACDIADSEATKASTAYLDELRDGPAGWPVNRCDRLLFDQGVMPRPIAVNPRCVLEKGHRDSGGAAGACRFEVPE